MRDVHLYKVALVSSAFTFFKNMILVYIWVPFLALLVLNRLTDLALYGEIILNLFIFILVYETGYIIADTIGVKFEDKKIRRVLYDHAPVSAIFLAITIRFLGVAVLLGVFTTTTQTLIAYALTILVFICHAFTKETYRIATFLGLRVLKGFVPYAALIHSLPINYQILVFIGLLGSAVYYSIEYYIKKLGGKIEFDIFSINHSFIKIAIVFSLVLICTIFFQMNNEPILFFAVFLIHHLLYLGLRLVGNKRQTDLFDVTK
jgi:hypothetical protein